MNLCSYNHDEICFDGRLCPMCQLQADHERDLDECGDKIAELENQIGELEYELEQARNND